MCDNLERFHVLPGMHRFVLPGALACAAALLLVSSASAQNNRAASSPATPSAADAGLIPLSAVVLDKKGPVKGLSQADFAVTVDGKPQTIRSFAPAVDLPLTVGVVVDVSRAQSATIDEEQRATQNFLDSLLKSAGDGHAVTKAFVMQYARTAELLQDVTNSEPKLQAGLKQVGTIAPGAAEDEDADAKDSRDAGNGGSNSPGNNNPGSNNPGSNNPGSGNPGNNNPGSSNPNTSPYGRGPYGRNGDGANTNSDVTRRRTGAVLYDSIFLATDDVTSHQPGRRVLVLLSDGVDRHSKESLTQALEATQRADTAVYAIYIKGSDRNTGMANRFPGSGGYDPYDPYGYPRQNYPGSGGSPGSDGTYADPDGRKILERLCGETGGHMFEAKGKDALGKIYAQITDELHAGYLLNFAPSTEVGRPGYHKVQVTITRPDMIAKKDDLQVRDGYYAGAENTR